MMMSFIGTKPLRVCLLFLWIASMGQVYAQDAAAPAASADSTEQQFEGGSNKGMGAVAVPGKKNYRRSRLTHDESEGKADKRYVLLATGEDRAVDLDFEANAGANGISIGNPQVVTTTLVKIGEKRQIVFKPLKAGETNVTVRDNDGTLRLIFAVRVSGSNMLRSAGELRELLKDIEGIEIKIVGPKIIVDGEILVPGDYARMISVISDPVYAPNIMNLTTLSPLAMTMLAERIQQDISTFAENVKTRVVNGMIFLEGEVDDVDKARRAAEVAKLYLPEAKPGNPIQSRDPTAQVIQNRGLVQNFIVVTPPPPKKQEKLVRVTIHFVELAKDYTKVFGFKWQPGFTADPQITIGTTQTGGTGAQANGSNGNASFTATISSLFPKLSNAQNAGYARILKTGTLMTRSGQPATLNEQTNIPFSVMGPNGQAASTQANVGLTVAVTPLILGQSEDIQLDLDLNQINLTGKSGSVPITASHAIKTKLYVKSSESAAVAGVISQDVGTDFNKDDPSAVAQGGQTSPLFTLMHSKSYRKKKSQFVIFVTPQIIENASDGSDDMKKNFRVKVK